MKPLTTLLLDMHSPVPREVRVLDIELLLGCDLSATTIRFGPPRKVRTTERVKAGSIALSSSLDR